MIQEQRSQPPTEIVCLEHQNLCLYAELIQVITARQRCWVRPLCLSVAPEVIASPQLNRSVIYDLRTCSDLLWPLGFFRPAVDLEVIPLLAQLPPDQSPPNPDPSLLCEQLKGAQQQLRQLMQSIWQAHPEAFSA